MRALLLVGFLLVCGSLQADVVTSFGDIQMWAGSGSNEAAMVIDWVQGDTTEPSLVWGYRWDGNATGEDMFRAIVSADPRLFAKVEGFGGGLGYALFGFGYDANNDGSFAITDGASFDADGIASNGSGDGATAVDPADRYAEGWFTGFWHYGVATLDGDGNPTNPYNGGSWSSSNWGMSSRQLANGDWDSWAFTPDFNFETFAENPVAAPVALPEPSSLAVLAGGAFVWYSRRRRLRKQATVAN